MLTTPDLYLYWASYLCRTNGNVLEAIANIDIVDPSCKLEKFLLEWAETRAPAHLDQALAMVENPSKARSSSYQMALLRSGIQTRQGHYLEAKQILVAAIHRSDLDWPEMVYEALAQHEAIHGDLESIKESRLLVERESEKLAKRRQKAAEQYQYLTPVEAAVGAVEEVPVEDKLER